MRRAGWLLAVAAVAIAAPGCGGARAPRFEGATGWNVVVEPGQTAVAANVRIAPGDRSQSLPSRTIASLPPRGVLLWLEWVHPRTHAADAKRYPQRPLPLRVEQAADTGAPEGASCPSTAPDCFIRHLTAREAGWDLDVWIFFGRDLPLPGDLAAADAELARLGVRGAHVVTTASPPADCPTPTGTGYYDPTVRPSAGRPGSTVTLSGRLPVLSESGQDVGQSSTEVVAYWNLDVSRWPSVATPTPAKADAGSPVELLGARSVAGLCSYRVRGTIPPAPPGTYPIDVLYGDVHGEASFAPADVRVTGG